MRLRTKIVLGVLLLIVMILSACDTIFGEPVIQVPGLAETYAAQTLAALTVQAPKPTTTFTPVWQPVMDISESTEISDASLNDQVNIDQITVQATSTPIPTLTPNPSITDFPQEVFSIDPDAPCNAAEFIRDVTIPDDTIVEPREKFTKIWAIRNIGTCTWERSEYALVLFWGNDMGTDRLVPLQFDVQPGNTADLAIDMEAPIVPGCWVSNWMLQDGEGTRFGVGPNYKNYFWVQVNVWWKKIPVVRVG